MYRGLKNEAIISNEKNSFLCIILDFIYSAGKKYVVLAPNDQDVLVVEEVVTEEKTLDYHPLCEEKQREIYEIFCETNAGDWQLEELVSVVEQKMIREEAKKAGLEVSDFVRTYSVNYLITSTGVFRCEKKGKSFEMITDDFLLERISEVSEYNHACSEATWEDLESWIVEKEQEKVVLKPFVIYLEDGSVCGAKYRLVEEYEEAGCRVALVEPVDNKEYATGTLQIIRGKYSGRDYYVYVN